MASYNHNIVRKRVAKEIREDNHQDWILFDSDQNNDPFLFVTIKLYPSLQKKAEKAGKDPALIISFPARYPWCPPNVSYYGKDIQELYRTNQIFEKDILKISDMGCMCCGSILCKHRWGITRKLQEIIDEFIKVTSWRARVVERLLCKKIQNQKIKLPVNDYPIFEFL